MEEPRIGDSSDLSDYRGGDRVRGDGAVPVTVTNSRGIPTWVKVAAFTVTLGIAVMAVVSVMYARYDARDRQRSCERAVAARDDNRAMWLRLGEKFPDSEEIQGLLVDLDELLPRLGCEHGHINEVGG